MIFVIDIIIIIYNYSYYKIKFNLYCNNFIEFYNFNFNYHYEQILFIIYSKIINDLPFLRFFFLFIVNQ